MAISYDAQSGVFHLQAGETSYALRVTVDGFVSHLYWGRRVRGTSLTKLQNYQGRAFSPETPCPGEWIGSLDTLPQEYPCFGTGDFRSPAISVELADGSSALDLRYRSHRIYRGKPVLAGLPATYVEELNEAETLELELIDNVSGVSVTLVYTAFEGHSAICRSVRVTNGGDANVRVTRVFSASVDLPSADFDMLQLSGAWARERHVHRRPLVSGMQSIESRRGASSHQQNPFLALLGSGATEESGDVYGLNLVYSGNFAAQVEVDQFRSSRVQLGINPFDFAWVLGVGEVFQAPEAVMVFSHQGLGGMSRTFHKLYRTRLCRGQFRDVARPILVNNWEATYFSFNADKIVSIAAAGKELGIELFVLDDGWFGKRDDDRTSLGDWVVDRRKLPNGLEDLAKRVTDLGMQFGLWFEPEMVSPDSDLYRAHPDWCLHVAQRHRTTGRNQLILDLSRCDVREYIVTAVSTILSSAPITYVKWDMNRHMTEVGSVLLAPEHQRETAHRYMLGVYEVMDRITSAFPQVLFESCSGGGGRFDPGILYYMPQTWTSDDTDAVERLKIQYGTSVVYPVSAMGSHVSAIPNHQVHRRTPLKTRGNVAMSGNFGYELDLTRFSEEEVELVKAQISLYKEIRSLVQQGDFYRLRSPFEGNDTAWMFVSADAKEAIIFYARVLTEPNGPVGCLRLAGLNPEMDYRLIETGEVYSGDELTYAGVNLPGLHGDYQSLLWRLQAV